MLKPKKVRKIAEERREHTVFSDIDIRISVVACRGSCLYSTAIFAAFGENPGHYSLCTGVIWL
jgi:hypothetical protein